ncbi:MAG: hypothetical protein RIQ47_503 [Bacteroidota bacterium]|jgi:nucleotide-binding universal stress UspA family protein
MKLIFASTDFSSTANNAVEYAAALAEMYNAHLIVGHAYDVPAMFTDAPLTTIKDARMQLKELSTGKLKKLTKKLIKTHPKLRMDTVSLEGVAHQKITEYALKKGVDLLVVGSTGTSRIQRLLMGSTTARVIRDARCAVLTIPQGVKFNGIKRMVYATDLHDDNIRAASMVIPFATTFDAELAFVFVDDKHLLHDDISVERMTKKIKSRVKYKKLSGYIAKNTNISRGLEYFLKKNPSDMLVLFTHERHFIDSLFNQSITRLVAYQSDLPLLSVKYTDRPLV